MMHRVFFLLLLTTTTVYTEVEENWCERYVECTAVALLEERLCLGNSRMRPYWLPQRHDPKNCHKKLSTDYKVLEQMEIDLEGQFLTCLFDNTLPLGDDACTSSILEETPKFSFERTISYIPTNCFMGYESRKERECSKARHCCPAYSKCVGVLTVSNTAKALDTMRENMKKRAKDCEKGISIPALAVSPAVSLSVDTDNSWTPEGHVNVHIEDLAAIKRKQQQKQQENQQNAQENAESGFVNVRFETAPREDLENRANRLLIRKGDKTNGPYGQVSQPTGGDHFRKAVFPSDSSPKTSILHVDNGDLELTGKRPELGFPGDGRGNIITGSPERELTAEEKAEDLRKRTGLPHNIETHDEAYEEALIHTKEYKAKLAKLAIEGKLANAGLNSLLDASRLSSVIKGTVTASDLPIFSSNKDVTPEEAPEVVTSRPILMKNDQQKQHTSKSTKKGCRPRALASKTKKMEKILESLGENTESKKMIEIRELLYEWEKEFRDKLVSAKSNARTKIVEEALEGLLSHFDDINLKLLQHEANATFPVEDYPTDDADIASAICDPLPLDSEENVQPQLSDSAELIETDEGTLILHDGVAKLLIASGNEVEVSASIDDSPIASEKEETTSFISDEYKQEIAEFQERRANATSRSKTLRNDTSCDLYMRCRNQMHVAVDACAWRFASKRTMPTLAESTESMLYKDEEMCTEAEREMHEELFELVIKRNSQLRECLDSKNEVYYEESVCMAYSAEDAEKYRTALKRLLVNKYKAASDCFEDANAIQEKCMHLRDCCPNFDKCRDDTLDVPREQAIISLTARMNGDRQHCIQKKARRALLKTLKLILDKETKMETLSRVHNGLLGLDIVRGAQLLRRL